MEGSVHPSINSASPALILFFADAAAAERNFYSGLAPRCDGELVDIVDIFVVFFWEEMEGKMMDISIHPLKFAPRLLYFYGRRPLASPISIADWRRVAMVSLWIL